MQDKELLQYIKNTEQMVLPEKVASIMQFSTSLRKLPVKIQKWISAKSSKKNTHMGFIVEPYSFFLAYEITDIKAAQKLLPPDYKIAQTSIFEGSTQRPSLIVSAFNVHTSVFWGSRVELYLIAENTKTGLMSWIIIDYESNTISYDPGQGFIGPSTSKSVVTTSFRGNVIVDVEDSKNHNRLAFNADINHGSLKPLYQRLWVDGNLSVDYGNELDDGESEPFGLIFDPDEMAQALSISSDDLYIECNTLNVDFTAKSPYEACCFPFAQHFLTTNMPVSTEMKNADDLKKAVKQFS